MKKVFAIIFATLILLSGMHLSFATHICGGEIASIKLSFDNQIATCGMENTNNNNSTHESITSDCCKNHITNYSIDNNYKTSSYQFQDISKNILSQFYISLNFALYSSNIITQKIYTNVYPPGILLLSDVILSDICVFRI